jgi:hypothetical protein
VADPCPSALHVSLFREGLLTCGDEETINRPS